MYCVKIVLQPTAALTFRILPGSILNITTYPFIPPTSLSGFLRRLAILQAGNDIPETKINKEKPPTYLLPRRYISLGAYQSDRSWGGIHRTYRKGMRSFTHDEFSRLYVDGGKANFQLHTWEYWLVEELIGYIASESAADLQHIQSLVNYGCYIGKEGYATVIEVSEIVELRQENRTAFPSTIVPADTLIQSHHEFSECDIYNLHCYRWLKAADLQAENEGLSDLKPTPVDGFIPFVGAYFPNCEDSHPTLEYYTNGEINIPVCLVNLLKA
jgi:hypothetical protein